MIIRDTPKGVGPAGPDMDDSEGFFCTEDADGNIIKTTSATEIPDGAVEIPASEGNRLTYVFDSFQGVMQVKLADDSPDVSRKDILALAAGGTATKDPGTGTRVQVARAREKGVAGQLLSVTLMTFRLVTA